MLTAVQGSLKLSHAVERGHMLDSQHPFRIRIIFRDNASNRETV